MIRLDKCNMCPRECGIDRTSGQIGFCSAGKDVVVSKIMLHKWEEPCISGENGAGTVFFSGCSLKCRYCQNYSISRELHGKTLDKDGLADVFLKLRDKGAQNIELITPTHFTLQIIGSLEKVKDRLGIPVIWNSGGYEKTETLRLLDGLVDAYLPDVKYFDNDLSVAFSCADDYFTYAKNAILEMYRQVGEFTTDEKGMIKKGLMIRHLVLPGHRKDSEKILRELADILPVGKIRLSLMSQYTPYIHDEKYKELNRKLTTFEYNEALNIADELGFDGYSQERTSSKQEYTPDFSEFDGI